jgi:hypothetical protein
MAHNGEGHARRPADHLHWDKPEDAIYMLVAYKKSAREDLTQGQLSTLRKLVEEWLE